MALIRPNPRPALAAVGLLLLAGCSTFTFDYRGLGALEPEGTDFNANLAREYKDFAQSEAYDMMDWIDAVHFGEKAFAAARNETPDAERPADWRLPEDAKAPIAEARERFLTVVVRGAREQSPVITARAQARLDCWIEQREENWQHDDIARCRDGFFAALNELEEKLVLSSPDSRPLTPVVPSTTAPSSVVSPIAELAAQQDGIGDGKRELDKAPAPRMVPVFFAFDSAELDDSGIAVITAVAQELHTGPTVILTIEGHADRAGGEAYNLTLSQHRADAVARALVRMGVPETDIEVSALGESMPLVATDDGVREPKNRRVEINTQFLP